MTADEVKEFWEVDAVAGLSPGEVSRRRAHFGMNALPESTGSQLWEILFRQWNDFMVLVLLGATAVAFFLGETTDAVVILCIVVANGVLGFLQEYRAEVALTSLEKMTAETALVMRDGCARQIGVEQLVPGDVVLLKAGERIPADIRLTTGEGRVDEAVLTGESIPVHKSSGVLSEDTHLTGRRNMLYSGTSIISGKARGVVVATGVDTELGEIASMLRDAERRQPPPLQGALERLGRLLLIGCLLISALIAVMGILQGKPLYEMLLTGISLAVAAIPEGLPAVVTVALAVGVQRMAGERAVVRNLKSVETLGCATTICTDKTGTLTRNRLRLELVSVGGREWHVQDEAPSGAHLYVLTAAVRCSDVRRVAPGEREAAEFSGDPTEVALAEALLHSRPSEVQAGGEGEFVRTGEIPFTASRRRMSVWGRSVRDGKNLLIMKGAPETILRYCSMVHCPDRDVEIEMSGRRRRQTLGAAADLSRRGYRVLGVAQRRRIVEERPKEEQQEDEETDLTFLGFVALFDPPRPECATAVQQCAGAGIRTVMVTGDHPLTARAVAERLDIIRPNQAVVTGEMLEAADARTVRRLSRTCPVFARVTPRQKLSLVRHMKDAGQVVVMTGDGVNDAPALGEAHIGVAMGRTGTAVTREAADLVLLDDNFATMVAAVREGRGVFDNIRRFIHYLLSCNIGEVLVMLVAAGVNLPRPLLPHQILLVNLVTDGLPAVALGMQKASEDLMCRPPRNVEEGVFAGGLSGKITIRGVAIGFLTVLCFAAALISTGHLEYARTVAVFALVASQLVHAVEIHRMGARRESIVHANPFLLVALLSSVAVLLAVVYVPGLASSMSMVPIRGQSVLMCCAVAVMSSPVHAMIEWVLKRCFGARVQSW